MTESHSTIKKVESHSVLQFLTNDVVKRIVLICYYGIIFSCEEDEKNPVPYSALIKRLVITNYRVDSMTNEGERCGWYVLEPVDSIFIDSVYMCSSLKIGDTFRLQWDNEMKGVGIPKTRKRD